MVVCAGVHSCGPMGMGEHPTLGGHSGLFRWVNLPGKKVVKKGDVRAAYNQLWMED